MECGAVLAGAWQLVAFVFTMLMAHMASDRDGGFASRDGGGGMTPSGSPFPPMNLHAMDPALAPDVVHEGISCDLCHAQPLRGVRYKCTGCPNFDVCATCYEGVVVTGGHGPTDPARRHLFLRVDDPRVAAAGRRDLANRATTGHAVPCAGCGAARIEGARFTCQQCINVHLCEGCEATGLAHDPSHARVKVGVQLCS